MRKRASNIFKGTASYYARYRRQYPKRVFSDIAEYYQLDGKGQLLDFGCGTGELTVPLSRHFEYVIGVDPSSDMLAEAKARAKRSKVTNITWMEKEAESLDELFGPICLTTIGAAFHWMDQALVLERIYAITMQSGGMVILEDASPVRGKSKTEDWKVKRKELIEKYLGPQRRAGDYLHKDFISETRPFSVLIENSPFRSFELNEYEYETSRNIDEIVGFLYSTSYSSKRLFGHRAEEFEQELRTQLLELVPTNKFLEAGKINLFLLTKN